MTSKVKVARSRDQSEVSWANAVSVPLAAGRGMPCRPKPAATLLVNHVSCLHMLPIDRARRDEQFELFLGKNNISGVVLFLWCAELYCHPPRPQAADGGAASRYRG